MRLLPPDAGLCLATPADALASHRHHRGAAIVFFLAKWIPVKDTYTNDLWVEISSQVVNGLFTITGVRPLPSLLSFHAQTSH